MEERKCRYKCVVSFVKRNYGIYRLHITCALVSQEKMEWLAETSKCSSCCDQLISETSLVCLRKIVSCVRHVERKQPVSLGSSRVDSCQTEDESNKNAGARDL